MANGNTSEIGHVYFLNIQSVLFTETLSNHVPRMSILIQLKKKQEPKEC
jgi:hypothetical protein